MSVYGKTVIKKLPQVRRALRSQVVGKNRTMKEEYKAEYVILPEKKKLQYFREGYLLSRGDIVEILNNIPEEFADELKLKPRLVDKDLTDLSKEELDLIKETYGLMDEADAKRSFAEQIKGMVAQQVEHKEPEVIAEQKTEADVFELEAIEDMSKPELIEFIKENELEIKNAGNKGESTLRKEILELIK